VGFGALSGYTAWEGRRIHAAAAGLVVGRTEYPLTFLLIMEVRVQEV